MSRAPALNALPGVRTRTALACLESAARELLERPVDLTALRGDAVTHVAPHPGGTLMRFRSGAAIVLPRGSVVDAAGAPVIAP